MTLPATPAVSAITRAAQARQINPLAMIAVAHSESGLNPRSVGDGGHAFGLFQNNNAGGTITGDPNPQRFFNPNVSANYAANAIGRLGLKGMSAEAQIRAIVERYERPKDPEAEVQRSIAYYRQALAGSVAPAVPAPLGKPKAATGTAQQVQSSTAPAINPLALAAYQQTQQRGQAAQQNAQDALGAISGHAHGVANPIDLTPYLDRVADVQQPQSAAPTPAAIKPKAVAPTVAPVGKGAFVDPLGATHYTRLGMPYQGTHGKTMNASSGSDNWESENAVDMGTPVGTPVYATQAGTIGNQIGSLGSSGRFAGQRVHLVTAGNEFYYAHLSKLAVKAGQRVQKGQLIGYSGEANGTPHLHIAAKKGNPAKDFGY